MKKDQLGYNMTDLSKLKQCFDELGISYKEHYYAEETRYYKEKNHTVIRPTGIHYGAGCIPQDIFIFNEIGKLVDYPSEKIIWDDNNILDGNANKPAPVHIPCKEISLKAAHEICRLDTIDIPAAEISLGNEINPL